ncbi:hypothetical protein ABZY34_13230 [Streptomyces virginiae]
MAYCLTCTASWPWDAAGLLHVLDLHRRAECLGLRVLAVGRQPRPSSS